MELPPCAKNVRKQNFGVERACDENFNLLTKQTKPPMNDNETLNFLRCF